jgi:hypothetical protein
MHVDKNDARRGEAILLVHNRSVAAFPHTVCVATQTRAHNTSNRRAASVSDGFPSFSRGYPPRGHAGRTRETPAVAAQQTEVWSGPTADITWQRRPRFIRPPV